MSQVIKKRKIVLASVLKPVDDTRMYEKMGQSLIATGTFDVSIIGFPSRKNIAHTGISFYALPKFTRLSLYRLTVPMRIFLKFLRLKPDVIIITTHELLIAGVLARLFTGTRLVYDIRENYYRNLLYLPTFPWLLRLPLALYVRIKEWLCSPWVSQFLLSDEGYSRELNFIRKKYLIIENKVTRASLESPAVTRPSDTHTLLFSGTLAPSTGVFTAISLAKALHKEYPSIRLLIIGYCSRQETLRDIRKAIKDCDFIQLAGGDQLVPHREIIHAIHTSRCGIIAYPPNPSTTNTTPTKLYEYIGAQLPILLIEHTTWAAKCAPYPAAILFNPDNIDAVSLIRQLKQGGFYSTPPGNEVFWESEADKLTEMLCQLTR